MCSKNITQTEFKEILKKHKLTVNQFLDLRDSWCKLSASDRYELIKAEIEEEK